MIVKLSAQEIVTAAGIGMRRQTYAMTNELRQYGNGTQEWFDAHIMGAMAEYAVAKTLNLFWHAHIGKIDQPDVGGFVEVRMRRVPGSGTDLAIRPKDKDQLPFVQVLGRYDGTFDIVGWLFGREAKQRGSNWCESNQIWYVPPPYKPIESLIELCRPSLGFVEELRTNISKEKINGATVHRA
jgi:hypothetical protein